MITTLANLAELAGGELQGEGSTPIEEAAALDVVQAGQITLIDGPDKLARLARSAASAAVVPRGTAGLALPAIAVRDVHEAFASIVTYFRPQRAKRRSGISSRAIVADSVRLGEDVDIHPLATIGEDVVIGRGVTIHAGVHVMAGCQIGDEATLMPGCVLYENTIVGPRTLIHAGAVIGCFGFGYEMNAGRHRLCAQLGYVDIGDDVEIGAGVTIDRGTYGPTVIGDGTKIDNLVQIAHNVRIGRHNLICSQVGIAGSTTTGDYVVLAGQVGVRDHVHIGDKVMVGAKAGVSNDIASGLTVFGIPATPQQEQKIRFAAVSKLPEMRKEFKTLKRTVEKLQDLLTASGNPRPESRPDALPK